MMDSARDFDLLGESVPQARVSACTFAILGIFQFFLHPGFPNHISLFFEHLGGRCSQLFDWLPSESGGICQCAPWMEVRQGYMERLPMTPMLIGLHVL